MKDLLVCGDERVERAIDAYFEPRSSSTSSTGTNTTATHQEAKGQEAGDEAPLQSKDPFHIYLRNVDGDGRVVYLMCFCVCVLV